MQIIDRIYVHLILRVQNGQPDILPQWQNIMIEFIRSHMKHHEQAPIEINAHRDHLHVLARLNVNTPVEEMIAMIKTGSKHFAQFQSEACSIAWSDEYICLSVGGFELEDVARHVRKQDQIHEHKTLSQEISDLLDQTEADVPIGLLNECGFLISPQDYSLN